MTPCTRCTAVAAFLISLALPAWGQQYFLYAPQPASSGQKSSSQDGILVQEVEVRKGDTLYGLSRRFSGRGMYFPQILLFNSIKDPNLIYPGNTLKVPVSQSDASDADVNGAKPAGAPVKSRKPRARAEVGAVGLPSPASGPAPAVTELSLSDLKPSGTGKARAARGGKKNALHTKTAKAAEPPPSSPPAAVAQPSEAAATATEQKLFEAAVKAYRKDDCRTALELFDRYLTDNSASPLAADANLYKAECYLKLSAQ